MHAHIYLGNILVCLLLFRLLYRSSTQHFYFYLLLFAPLLLNFDLIRFCMPLLKLWGYSFKEHPLTSYDVQIPKSAFLEAFLYMGHGIFHSTLKLGRV